MQISERLASSHPQPVELCSYPLVWLRGQLIHPTTHRIHFLWRFLLIMSGPALFPDRKDVDHSDQLAPLYFLDRSELWDTVKPYNFHYFPKENFPLHNLQRSSHVTRVRSMRPLVPTLSLDAQGFEVHRLDTKMKYADFKDEERIQATYFRELEKYFNAKLGAKKVRALDFQLRQRDPQFPYFGGKPHPTPQPSLMVHVDVTLAATKAIIHELYGDSAAAQITKSKFQVITVWRPLAVPVRDWPLALCDASSVDQADFVDTDVIYPNYIAENRMLHFDADQKWYWLPDQTADEVLVFKAIDSDELLSSPCPHGAFPLPGQDQDTMSRRESIDVRLLVMYADMIYPESKPWAS
ncbi:hypothetical protein, variant [Blastomyces gilchristii SLH14081]|uniref:Methyltransferase n=2 Tax=Blastomyces TaxID=229219 RepID=A0A179V2E5_BLAGS|nr:hypothetical protein, variant [Blastomyces gilchristii SLH14081]XP_031580988.1 uncharacterized protein BDBG_08750 [Blastomyces gilchristii SLH14081]OAT13576.1 hypothetical protein BDBG_08750 [Blastomyces gilchristii SLH14081]OAT13577.1 hypothetical protein, variant [Blastomyces gilchristii SLH14081]